jgi:hypothetical protein
MPITRKPWFWVAHTLFFAACVFYAWKNFDRAFPFVDLQVKMSRAQALQEAASLSSKHGWYPKGRYDEAVTFDTDSSTQNFIELEAGGPAALKRVLKEGIYLPYTWRVRHFAEGQVDETRILFSPDGRPWGLSEKLSEDDPGAALPADQARAIAEKEAQAAWGVDLEPYHLAEQSSETRKSKRVDHSFIYERDQKIGEGRYRLTLGVSGDRLTEVNRYIKVPDAFYRRYSAMRSANGTIAQLAGAAVVLLYGLGLCGFGLFALARSRWVVWRAPVWVAAVIAGLHFLDELNRLPLEWMDYDTAITAQAFALRAAAGALLSSLFDFVLVVIPLIAAESMSRKAFPRQPQLWRIFSFAKPADEPGAPPAASRQVLGRVLGAWLFVGFHFAWVVWIYRMGSEHLGWWNPSELLFHPDELATYFPWLTSVANSLHAGIWEECLFRGVPLAGAALLGSRYGKRGAWVACAFVLQALIFGAAHASYPTQPSYARLVELLVPSAVFGGVYLGFGLLPGILMHYTYDVTLFAMPLFLSSGRSALVSQLLVIVLSATPLWILLGAGWVCRGWGELAPSFLNGAWHPSERAAPRARVEHEQRPLLGPGQRKAFLASVVVALAIWAGLATFKADAPGLKIDSLQAITEARKALEARGVRLGPEWRALAIVEGTPGEEDDFVWRVSGREAYRKLLGTFLEPPHWKIRFARFEGDLVERAEERQVFVLGTGEIERVRHELPESRPGASLDEKQAKALAASALRERLGADPAKLVEVSSNQYQLPQRRDWVFVWRDPSQPLKQGEARLAVKIAGDEEVGYRRYVHVPEDWLRAERARRTAIGLIRMLAGSALGCLVIWITFLAFQAWIHGEFSRRVFAIALAALLAAAAIARFNEFQEAVAQFNTAQPWSSQVLRVVVSDLLLALVTSAVAAVCLGRGYAPHSPARDNPGPAGLWLGYGLGAWLSALGAFGAWLGRGQSPDWPTVAPAGASLPALEVVQAWAAYAGGTAFLVLVISWVERRFVGRGARAAVSLALGLAAGAFVAETSLAEWLAASAACAAAIFGVGEVVRRTSPALLVPLTAGALCLRALRTVALGAFPGAALYGALLIAGVAALSWRWFSSLTGGSSRASPTASG